MVAKTAFIYGFNKVFLLNITVKLHRWRNYTDEEIIQMRSLNNWQGKRDSVFKDIIS